jgi:hypothetical protein
MGFYPSKDLELEKWSETLLEAIVTNGPGQFGLVTSDVTALTAVVDNFKTQLASAQLAEQARLAATVSKDSAKRSLTVRIGQINKKVQAAGISAAVKTNAGLPVYDTDPSPIIAQDVDALVATPFWNGDVKLKWPRSGNKPGVKFNIFSSSNLGETWTLVTVTTATKFTDKNQTPGDTTWYRVQAFSKTNTANFSPIAMVYPGGAEEFLRAAA